MRGTVFTMSAAALLAAGAATAQTPAPKISDAGPNDLRVLAVSSIRTPITAGLAGAEKAIGRHIVIQYGGARADLKDAVMGGQDFEVALLLPDVDKDLAQAGKIMPGAAPIGQVLMGFAERGDASVDFSSADAIRKTLLAAKSVKFGSTGSGMPVIQKMLRDLGIEDTIKHHESSGPAVPLDPGEYEILLYPMSEILPNKNVKNLGPFPEPWRIPVVVHATIGAHARDAAAAKALVDYLQSPAMTAILAQDAWTPIPK